MKPKLEGNKYATHGTEARHGVSRERDVADGSDGMRPL